MVNRTCICITHIAKYRCRFYDNGTGGCDLCIKISPAIQNTNYFSKMETEFGHVMVDIETLGKSSKSVILSIAAVQFNLETGATGMTLYRKISIESCLSVGLKVDGSTIKWWMAQDDKAREELCGEESITTAIGHLSTFIGVCGGKEVKIWGNGSRFDLGLIMDAFALTPYPIPWKYSNERDLRTLVSFAPEIKEKIPFEGIKHNPLADCLHQIKYASEIWRALKINL